MNAETLLPFLGKSFEDEQLLAFLRQQKMSERPVLAPGDFRTYVEYPAEGISFVYTSEPYFKGIKNVATSNVPLVLTGIFLYAEGVDDYSEFPGKLPDDLSFRESREDTVQRFGESAWQLKDRDGTTVLAERWDNPDYRLRVNYAKDGNTIKQIYYGLPDAK